MQLFNKKNASLHNEANEVTKFTYFMNINDASFIRVDVSNTKAS